MRIRKTKWLFSLVIMSVAISKGYAQQEADLGLNSDLTLKMNLAVQQKIASVPLQRLSSYRSFARGMSYGDMPVDMGVWVNMQASGASKSSQKNNTGGRLPGFDVDSSGYSFGVEGVLNGDEYNLVYGVSLGTTDVKGRKQSSDDRNTLKNYQFGIYSSFILDEWYLDSVINFGHSQNDRLRYIDSSLPVKSGFKSKNYGVKLLAGFNYPYWNTSFQPIIGINYVRIHSEDFREHDTARAGQAQDVKSLSYQKAELGVGLEMSRIYQLSQGAIEPSARIMGWYDAKGESVKASSTIIDSGTNLTAKVDDPVKGMYSASFNLTYRRLDNLSVAFSYDLHKKSGYQSDSFSLRAEYDF